MSSDELSPTDAFKRFIARRETDASDRTIHSYESRLDHFVEWCEEHGIDDVADLTPRHIDDYSLNRRQGYERVTVQGHLATLQVLLKYLDRVGFVDQQVAEAVDVPNLSAEEQSSDERLRPPMRARYSNTSAIRRRTTGPRITPRSNSCGTPALVLGRSSAWTWRTITPTSGTWPSVTDRRRTRP